MTIALAQILLEGAQFAHNGNYLAKQATTEAASHRIRLDVEVVNGADKSRAGVRLKATSEVADEEEPQYKLHASYLALFTLDAERDAEFDKRLAVTGATMLQPFMRELVANLTQRGRFGPVWMAPVNFNDLISPASKKVAPSQRSRSKAKPR